MPVDKVHFHVDFLYGTCDTEYFKDFASFDVKNNPQDLLHFSRIEMFAKSVLKGNMLTGKNVENTGGYSGYDTWHYHSGPWGDLTNITQSKVEEENLSGAKSGPAIHYTWQGEFNEIVILGYSPLKHDQPFPQLHHVNNPLKDRVRSPEDIYNDSEIVDFTDVLNPPNDISDS